MLHQNIVSSEGPDQKRFQSIERRWLENYAELLRHARSLSKNTCVDPEDLVSRATLKILSACRESRDIKNFASLMHIALRHEFIDSRRRCQDRIFHNATALSSEENLCDLPDEQADSEQSLIARETLGAVVTAISEFSKFYQDLFELRFLKQKSFADIADIMDISEANARQRIRHLRRLLRRRLEVFGISVSQTRSSRVLQSEGQ